MYIISIAALSSKSLQIHQTKSMSSSLAEQETINAIDYINAGQEQLQQFRTLLQSNNEEAFSEVDWTGVPHDILTEFFPIVDGMGVLHPPIHYDVSTSDRVQLWRYMGQAQQDFYSTTNSSDDDIKEGRAGIEDAIKSISLLFDKSISAILRDMCTSIIEEGLSDGERQKRVDEVKGYIGHQFIQYSTNQLLTQLPGFTNNGQLEPHEYTALRSSGEKAYEGLKTTETAILERVKRWILCDALADVDFGIKFGTPAKWMLLDELIGVPPSVVKDRYDKAVSTHTPTKKNKSPSIGKYCFLYTWWKKSSANKVHPFDQPINVKDKDTYTINQTIVMLQDMRNFIKEEYPWLPEDIVCLPANLDNLKGQGLYPVMEEKLCKEPEGRKKFNTLVYLCDQWSLRSKPYGRELWEILHCEGGLVDNNSKYESLVKDLLRDLGDDHDAIFGL